MSQLKSLILASASPRRKELLSSLGLSFQVIAADIDETSNEKNPASFVEKLALKKGEKIKQAQVSPSYILAADTIVSLEQQILGKPKSIDDAKKMLLLLSGKTHQVFTGVWIGDSETDKYDSFSVQTDITFRKIPFDLLDAYLETHDSMDKAGSYGIQSGAMVFVERVEGCYSNVVGLPLVETDNHLREMLQSSYQELKRPKR